MKIRSHLLVTTKLRPKLSELPGSPTQLVVKAGLELSSQIYIFSLMNLVNPVVRMRRKNNLKPCETICNYCATGEIPFNVFFVIPLS